MFRRSRFNSSKTGEAHGWENETRPDDEHAERRDANFQGGLLLSRMLRARLRAYRIRTPSIIKKESDSRSSKAEPGKRAFRLSSNDGDILNLVAG